MKRNFIDLTGQKFGKLIPITMIDKRDSGGRVYWNCLCECNKNKIIMAKHLISGATKSCGCLIGKSNKKHGLSNSRIYITWCGMMSRCYNPNVKAYHNYGGRGIKVCDRWLKFENFYKDMGDKPKGLSLDRIDNNKGYYKENCKWATHSQQQENTRRTRLISFNGKTQCLTRWSKELNISFRTLMSRFNLGWSISEAFLTPIQTRVK